VAWQESSVAKNKNAKVKAAAEPKAKGKKGKPGKARSSK
jgi:hypothetical protein